MSGEIKKSFYNYQVRILTTFTILSLTIFLIIIYATLSRYFDRDFHQNLENQSEMLGRQLQEHLGFIRGQLNKYCQQDSFINDIRNNYDVALERVQSLFADSPGAAAYLGLFSQNKYTPPPAELAGLLASIIGLEGGAGSPGFIIMAGPENEIYALFKTRIESEDRALWVVLANNLSRDLQFIKFLGPDKDLYLKSGSSFLSLKNRTILPLPPETKIIFKKGYPEKETDWALSDGLASIEFRPDLFLKVSTESLRQKKSTIFLWMFFISCSVLLMSLVVTFLISRAVSEPLKNLVRQTAGIAEDPQGKTLLESELEYKEFAGLARAFNQVLQSLEDARRQLEKGLPRNWTPPGAGTANWLKT